MSSLDKYAKMYEKMKKKPGFNVPAQIEQPTPKMAGNQVVSEIDRNIPTPPSREEIDDSVYNEELKQKILEAAAARGKNLNSDSSKIQTPSRNITKTGGGNLEKRIAYLEEAVKLIMDQQMKILRG